MVMVVILAMQNPKTIADMTNFFFFRRLTWKMLMWTTAPNTKRTRKTEVMGSSTFFVGKPPTPAVVGKYGGPLAFWRLVRIYSLKCENKCVLLLDWTS
jgi:hypothetical protein